MAQSGDDIKSKVDAIIDERRRLLPEVEHEFVAVSNRSQRIHTIRALLSELLSIESDEDSKRWIEKVLGDLSDVVEALRSREKTLVACR